jgi:hypothetical protein
MKTTLIIFSLLTLVSCGCQDGGTGAKGKDGTNGVNGKDGSSCHVNSVSNGAIITCDDGTQSIVMNGEKGDKGDIGSVGETGEKGDNGTNGISPVLETIDPCGNGTGFDEVIIKTSSGFIAYFEDGSKRFLAKLDVGSYRTTDQQACRFSVNVDGSITW